MFSCIGAIFASWCCLTQRNARPVACTTDLAQVIAFTHRQEMANGRERFPVQPTSAAPLHAAKVADRTLSVGVGYAGPDEGYLRDGHLIHSTVEPILSVDECDAIVTEAKSAIETGETSSFTYTQASRIGEVHVHSLPSTRMWLSERLHDTFYPWLASAFGDPSDPHTVVAVDELAVYDALVIHYNAAEGGGTRQPMHRDAALISINIALSPPSAFAGGGTYFESVGGEPLQLEQGHAMCHASGARHAGYSITSGERWVLVIFVLAERAVMPAFRYHGEAVFLRRAGKLAESLSAFAEAIRSFPMDHELRHGLANSLLQVNEFAGARASLAMAIMLYPFCPKPRNALGSLLLHAGRPRAALRHFESAFERGLGPEDDDGWEAAVNIAQCIITLAEREAASVVDKRRISVLDSRWHGRLQEARQHLQRSLAVLTDDEETRATLASLLARC